MAATQPSETSERRHDVSAQDSNKGESLAWLGLAAEPETMNQERIQIGIRENYGQKFAFGISIPDLRQHVHVIGKTGVGKTTLIRNMVVQLMSLGHGIGILDPHGGIAEELLDCVPLTRTKKVIYFNPSDAEFPFSLNLLANVPKDDRHLVASGIVGAFKSIFPDSWGPRMEYIFYNAIAALLECQNTSLLGVNKMLTDDRYRAWVIRQVHDPFIKNFWENEFANYDDRFRNEACAPIHNKLGRFLLNPIIRNILGQVRCSINFRHVMDSKSIFIANLSKGKIGDDKANLLGSLLTSQFQLAAMSRVNVPESKRVDYFLFLDEFASFTTESFVSILSEARKYRLGMVLSHQYVEQIPLTIRHAIFGNVGTTLAFRIGNADGEVLQKEFSNVFAAHQFVDLEKFHIFSKILEDGTNENPFMGRTLEPLGESAGGIEGHILFSRQRFAVSRKAVEDNLQKFFA